MKTIVKALQDLYVAMGGTASDVENLSVTPDMIEAIAEVYEDKGDTLPKVTSADNGDVLTVVNGAWDKADAAKELPAVTGTDNGKVLKVVNGAWEKAAEQTPVIYPEYSYDEENTEWVCDKTFEEIATWIAAGRVAIARLNIVGNTFGLIPIAGVIESDGNIVAVSFSIAAPSASDDVKLLTTVYIGHSELGIDVATGQGYLSATDPNT